MRGPVCGERRDSHVLPHPLQAPVKEVPSAEPINTWAANATRGLIPKAVPDDLDFSMVLTNAVYFLGGWDWPFNTSRTQPDALFTNAQGAPVQVRLPRTGTAAVASSSSRQRTNICLCLGVDSAASRQWLLSGASQVQMMKQEWIPGARARFADGSVPGRQAMVRRWPPSLATPSVLERIQQLTTANPVEPVQPCHVLTDEAVCAAVTCCRAAACSSLSRASSAA